jgi:hypothetical protein
MNYIFLIQKPCLYLAKKGKGFIPSISFLCANCYHGKESSTWQEEVVDLLGILFFIWILFRILQAMGWIADPKPKIVAIY